MSTQHQEQDLLPSPWDWVPTNGLVLTRGCTLNVCLSPASNVSKFTASSWEMKKTVNTMCPNGCIPLLLEAVATRGSGTVCAVFEDESECQVVFRKVDRQLITINKTKYFAEATIYTSEVGSQASIKEEDMIWQNAFSNSQSAISSCGESLVTTVQRLWKNANGSSKECGDKPDTLIVCGLPAKWFDVDTTLLSDLDEENSTKETSQNKNLETVRYAFSRFGTLKHVEASLAGASTPSSGFGKGNSSLLSGALGLGGLNIDLKVCFEEPEGLAVALSALRGAILSKSNTFQTGEVAAVASTSTSAVPSSSIGAGVRLVVTVDVEGFFKASSIAKRKALQQSQRKAKLEAMAKSNQLRSDAQMIVERAAEKFTEIKKEKSSLEELFEEGTKEDKLKLQDDIYQQLLSSFASTEYVLTNASHVVRSRLSHESEGVDTSSNNGEPSSTDATQVDAEEVFSLANQADESVNQTTALMTQVMNRYKSLVAQREKEQLVRTQYEELKSQQLEAEGFVLSLSENYDTQAVLEEAMEHLKASLGEVDASLLEKLKSLIVELQPALNIVMDLVVQCKALLKQRGSEWSKLLEKRLHQLGTTMVTLEDVHAQRSSVLSLTPLLTDSFKLMSTSIEVILLNVYSELVGERIDEPVDVVRSSHERAIKDRNTLLDVIEETMRLISKQIQSTPDKDVEEETIVTLLKTGFERETVSRNSALLARKWVDTAYLRQLSVKTFQKLQDNQSPSRSDASFLRTMVMVTMAFKRAAPPKVKTSLMDASSPTPGREDGIDILSVDHYEQWAITVKKAAELVQEAQSLLKQLEVAYQERESQLEKEKRKEEEEQRLIAWKQSQATMKEKNQAAIKEITKKREELREARSQQQFSQKEIDCVHKANQSGVEIDVIRQREGLINGVFVSGISTGSWAPHPNPTLPEDRWVMNRSINPDEFEILPLPVHPRVWNRSLLEREDDGIASSHPSTRFACITIDPNAHLGIQHEEDGSFSDKDAAMMDTSTGDIYCELCDITCRTQQDFAEHLAGKKHTDAINTKRKRVEEGTSQLHCKVCNVTCCSKDMEQHLQGKKHRAANAAANIMDRVGPEKGKRRRN